MPSSTSIPIIVQGNSFSLAIPLQIYVISEGSMVLQDYTPDPTDEVSIQLKGDRRQYTYTPTITDNIATIDLSGNELADNYAVVVSIVKANGQRLRSFRTDQLFIVESSDDLTMDDIIAGLEENVIYLNAQAFISLGEVVISDSTTTFDANSALSAKQGAILRENIELILSSLGEYAFPDGKPTLDWSGGTLAVTLNLTDFSSSNMAETTQRGSAYTTTLTPAHSSNLYVNDVVIMMGDEDITATAYNESTGVVSIAEVTGAIEITAQQITYIQDGLVSMFDGMNRGGVAGEWADVKDNTRKMVLTNCTENANNVYFNGTSSKATATSASTAVEVECTVGTIECVSVQPALATNNEFTYPITNAKVTGKFLLVLGMKRLSGDRFQIGFCQNVSGGSAKPKAWKSTSAITTSHLSISDARGYLNGEALTRDTDELNTLVSSNSRLTAFSFVSTNGTQYYREGTLYNVRFYNRQLTEAEVLHNYNVDKKRFNLQ